MSTPRNPQNAFLGTVNIVIGQLEDARTVLDVTGRQTMADFLVHARNQFTRDEATLFAERRASALAQHEPLLQFFEYDHLPQTSHLQETGRQFAALAYEMVIVLPRNPERTVALRRLLDAKDAAVRAVFYKPAP